MIIKNYEKNLSLFFRFIHSYNDGSRLLSIDHLNILMEFLMISKDKDSKNILIKNQNDSILCSLFLRVLLNNGNKTTANNLKQSLIKFSKHFIKYSQIIPSLLNFSCIKESDFIDSNKFKIFDLNEDNMFLEVKMDNQTRSRICSAMSVIIDSLFLNDEYKDKIIKVIESSLAINSYYNKISICAILSKCHNLINDKVFSNIYSRLLTQFEDKEKVENRCNNRIEYKNDHSYIHLKCKDFIKSGSELHGYQLPNIGADIDNIKEFLNNSSDPKKDMKIKKELFNFLTNLEEKIKAHSIRLKIMALLVLIKYKKFVEKLSMYNLNETLFHLICEVEEYYFYKKISKMIAYLISMVNQSDLSWGKDIFKRIHDKIVDTVDFDDKNNQNVEENRYVLILKYVCKVYKDDLFEKLTYYKEMLTCNLVSYYNDKNNDGIPFRAIHDDLKIIVIIYPFLPLNPLKILTKIIIFPIFSLVTMSPTATSINLLPKSLLTKCLLILYEHNREIIMLEFVKNIINSFKNIENAEIILNFLYNIINKDNNLKDILIYLPFFIRPILYSMNNGSKEIRNLAYTCFSSVMKLSPLEHKYDKTKKIPESIISDYKKEKEFIDQIFGFNSISTFELPFKIKLKLREYQVEGVSWLWFLRNFYLNGILCDEMGLGKTIQAICIVFSDHFYENKLFNKKGISLVIVPSTLVPHWTEEILKSGLEKDTIITEYIGSPKTRKKLRDSIILSNHKNSDLVITTYDIIRNDYTHLNSINWNYIILDEGHIIKNSKTKIFKAIKTLKSTHRLVLTGTPIQNNVLELWTIFDFLMPNYLGEEKWFKKNYLKPINFSYNQKRSSLKAEMGFLKLNTLHKKILPFCLCRLKSNVLKQLPPKIISDRYVSLCDLQKVLYDFLMNNNSFKSLIDSYNPSPLKFKNKIINFNSHIFQALNYIRKLLIHPSLVLTSDHPLYESEIKKLKSKKIPITSPKFSPKIFALIELLHECIDLDNRKNNNIIIQDTFNNKILIFAQSKATLNLIEEHVLEKEFWNVQYKRIDGNTKIEERKEIIQDFQRKESKIEILLMTTRVGGLGLNLTSANIVIIVEHDWNPFSDLQAMDRVHRLGQEKIVNVYRIIIKNTIEERILGSQKFKKYVSKTILDNEEINSEERKNLGTVLEDSCEHSIKVLEEKKLKKNKRRKIASKFDMILEDFGELWDEKQYDKEFSLTKFIKSLKN